MTKKFEGIVTVGADDKIIMPSNEKVPDKKDWHSFSIWEFNGKAWRPCSLLAEDNLEKVVQKLQSSGYKYATKVGKLKPSSLKYAIKTTGVEDFYLCK